MKEYRHRFQIIYELLTVISEGHTKTSHIERKVNLNSASLNKYLVICRESGLLAGMALTAHGKEFLRTIREINMLLDEAG